MYTVIVADDEPSSLNHICTIIEMKCTGFQIVARAENGRSALEEVRKHKPDILISDVKMPLMNGIELTSAVKKELPECISIIVSGYQDFEYVKGALQAEVCDYLLKPVTPANLKTILDNAEKKLEKIYYQGRNKLVRKLWKTGEADWQIVHKFFPYSRYYAALIRKNGLPRRFSNSTDIEVFSEMGEKLFVYGRDEMESLYIMPEDIVFNKSFKQFIQDMTEKEKKEQQYMTCVLVNRPFDVKEMPKVIKKLYRELDTRCVIGLNQCIVLDEDQDLDAAALSEGRKEELLKKIELLIKERQYDAFRKELKGLLEVCQQQKKSQLWVEGMARQILYILQKYNDEFGYDSKYEFMLDDAFYYATTTDELLESLHFIFNRNMKEDGTGNGKVDTPEFLKTVKGYLKQNISEEISLQMVCKKFAVSQTYLSRIFRKYEDTSFNNYLTNLRIEEAKALMLGDGEIFIKDVASLVGYKDQFYFSRIFRSITGMCPSDFMEGKMTV